MEKNIIIAGGGTGGHIFRAITIAHAIKKIAPATNILFVGAKNKMEMDKVPEADYTIRGLSIMGYNRRSLISNLWLPFKLVKSFYQVRRIFIKFKPDAVIGVGGYSSFPVLRYAQLIGIPSFIHEANSFAGKTNILLGKLAAKIFVGHDGMEKFFPADKIIISGNPVRKDISENMISCEEGIKFFGLDPAKKTVLAIGGSLGAKAINEAINEHIKDFGNSNVQLVWQTGKLYAATATALSTNYKNIWVDKFITRMEYAYAAADVVIARAGAMTIAELSASGKPAILVPFPFAAEDHQTANAQSLVNKHAGLMIKDHEAAEKLVPAVIALAQNEQVQNEFKKNIRKLAISNADEIIAKEVLRLISE